jgi:hypothetical protein
MLVNCEPWSAWISTLFRGFLRQCYGREKERDLLDEAVILDVNQELSHPTASKHQPQNIRAP